MTVRFDKKESRYPMVYNFLCTIFILFLTTSYSIAETPNEFKLQFYKAKKNEVIFTVINGSGFVKGSNLEIENYDFNRKTIPINILKISKDGKKILTNIDQSVNYIFKSNEYFKNKRVEKISTYQSPKVNSTTTRTPASVEKSENNFAGFDHINEQEIERYFENDSSVKTELEMLNQQLGAY